MIETTLNNQNKAEKLWVGLEHYYDDPKFLELAQKEFLSSPLSNENGGEFGLRAYVALPPLALQIGDYRKAASLAPQLDKGWDSLAGFSRYGKAWVAMFVTSRDELSAIAAIAQFALARQRVEREHKDKPGKFMAADLTQSFEKSAETAMQKIKANLSRVYGARVCSGATIVGAWLPRPEHRAGEN